MAPLPPYRPPDATSADAVPVAGGSFAHPDRLYDLSVKVGGIERSITFLEAQGEKTDKKLDSITQDITTAKATFGTLKFVFIALCAGTWGLILGLFLLWAKHYFNW